MKTTIAAVLLGISLVTLISCEKKSEPERVVDKIENKVDDALDRRPGEKIRDAAEDVADKVKDATN